MTNKIQPVGIILTVKIPWPRRWKHQFPPKFPWPLNRLPSV